MARGYVGWLGGRGGVSGDMGSRARDVALPSRRALATTRLFSSSFPGSANFLRSPHMTPWLVAALASACSLCLLLAAVVVCLAFAGCCCCRCRAAWRWRLGRAASASALFFLPPTPMVCSIATVLRRPHTHGACCSWLLLSAPGVAAARLGVLPPPLRMRCLPPTPSAARLVPSPLWCASASATATAHYNVSCAVFALWGGCVPFSHVRARVAAAWWGPRDLRGVVRSAIYCTDCVRCFAVGTLWCGGRGGAVCCWRRAVLAPSCGGR